MASAEEKEDHIIPGRGSQHPLFSLAPQHGRYDHPPPRSGLDILRHHVGGPGRGINKNPDDRSADEAF